MKAVLSNRIYMNRTPEINLKLMEALHYVLPPKQPNLPPEEECDVTRVNKNIVTIPIGRQDLIPEGFEIVDKRVYKPVNFPKFKFELYEEQQKLYDRIEDNCIIKANPSFGKTFTAIAIASKFSQKTLVVLHNTYLADQWSKEIRKTLGIEPGKIYGGEENLDSVIVISTMQTLRNKVAKFISEFGTIIVDETHHVPAPVFKSILDKFKARYKIGLTATPWRKDGRHVMLYDYFGGQDAEFVPKDGNFMTPTITIIETEIPFSSNSMIPWPKRLNDLYDNHDYMELILNLSQAQAERGYKVLTVADRVEFLRTCAEVLDDFMLITGATENREFDIKADGILGTTKIFAEGINIPVLSSLVMGVPINNRSLLDQLIGRICRKHEGKPQPEVLDIALKGKTAKNQLGQRINYYMNEGYKIRRL